MLGGVTGLAGILVTIWCGLRGWPKEMQRTVFQPVAVAIFLMSALWIGAKGAITPEIIKLFLIGLPALFAGTWLSASSCSGGSTKPASAKWCWRCCWRRELF